MNEKEDKTLYDKVIARLKNSKIIVGIIILFTVYIAISQFVKATADNKKSIVEIIATDKDMGEKFIESEDENENPKVSENEEEVTNEKKADSINIKQNKPVKNKYSFYLVLNSDQINANKFLNGSKANIISGQSTVYQEVAINDLNKNYTLKLISNKYNCEDTVYIYKHRQNVYPCK